MEKDSKTREMTTIRAEKELKRESHLEQFGIVLAGFGFNTGAEEERTSIFNFYEGF